jgi:hypothetical protein
MNRDASSSPGLPCQSWIAQEGGCPPLVGTVTLLASLALISFGVGALLLMRRSVS